MRARSASASISTSPTAALELRLRHHVRVTRTSGILHDPGHGDNLVAAHDDRPRRRARPAAPSRRRRRPGASCCRPASRSPGRRVRTSRPGTSDSIVQGPSGPGPCSSETRSYSRTAVIPPPRSRAFEPVAVGEQLEQRLLHAARQAGPLVGERGAGSARRAGWSRRRSGTISVADQAARACPGSTSRRGTRARSRGSRPRSPRARAVEQRADDAVLAPRLDPARRAAGDEPVERRSRPGRRPCGRWRAGRGRR